MATFASVDNPLYNKWLDNGTFIQLLLSGQQICNFRPGPDARHFHLLEQLFPGLSLEHFYHAPEVLCFRSCQVVKPATDLVGGRELCRTIFWVALPEALCFRFMATSKLFVEDLDWALSNLQFGMCPRSALLLSTFSFSIFQAQRGSWHPLGHQRMTLIGLRMPLFFVRTLVQNGHNFWNRYYLDHFMKIEVNLGYFELPRQSTDSAALYTFSMSFNRLAHELNQVLYTSGGNFVRYGHLIVPATLRDRISDDEHVIPHELLAPLFRSRL